MEKVKSNWIKKNCKKERKEKWKMENGKELYEKNEYFERTKEKNFFNEFLA